MPRRPTKDGSTNGAYNRADESNGHNSLRKAPASMRFRVNRSKIAKRVLRQTTVMVRVKVRAAPDWPPLSITDVSWQGGRSALPGVRASQPSLNAGAPRPRLSPGPGRSRVYEKLLTYSHIIGFSA